MIRVVRSVIIVLGLILGLGGCGDSGSAVEANWPAVGEVAPVDGLVWAEGSTVHLPDGSDIATEDPISAYAVVGGGVVFQTPGDDELYWADGSGARGLGVKAHTTVSLIEASPDGRYLAYADVTEDPDTIEAVVVDFTTGEEVVRSDEGFTTSGDQADAYEEIEPGLIAVDDETAWFRTLDGDVAYSLATGERSEVPEGEKPWQPHGGDAYGVWNPSHTWEAVGEKGEPGRLVGPDGADLVPPDGGSVIMVGDSEWGGLWFDDKTRLGRLKSGSGISLLACRVDQMECVAVPGTESPQGRAVTSRVADGDHDPIVLPQSHHYD